MRVTGKELSLAVEYAIGVYSNKPRHDVTVFRDKTTSTKAILYRQADYDVLAWCGTADPKDFIIDATAIPWRYKGHWMHAGFQLAHRSLWPQIKPHLIHAKTLIVTGHSLGGALAEITGLCLNYRHGVRVITFGKPNVFAKWSIPYMHWLDCQVSVVSGSDIVTRSPRIMYGPSSSQQKLYFPNRGDAVWNPSSSFVKQDMGLFDRLSDHSGDQYFSKVNGYVAFTFD